MKRVFISFIYISTIGIFLFNSQVHAETISLESLFNNLIEAERSFEDYSSKFVAITGGSSVLAELNSMMEESFGQSLPQETEMLVWIKKPYLMRTKIPSSLWETIVKKEGEDFYAYYWYPSMNTLRKVKMPINIWPSYPSLEAELISLKKLIENVTSYNIEQKEGEEVIVLTILSFNSKRKDVYYINESNWTMFKRLIYENGEISITYEWHDIQLNTGLSDNFFEFQIPEGAKRTTEDLSKPK